MPSRFGPGDPSMGRIVALIVIGLMLFGLFLATVLLLLSMAAERSLGGSDGVDADFVTEVEIEDEDGRVRPVLLTADVGSRCIGVAGSPSDDGPSFDSTACGEGGLVESEIVVLGRPMTMRLAVAGSDASVAEMGACDQEWTEVLNGFIATWCLVPA